MPLLIAKGACSADVKDAGKVKCRVQRSDLMGWVGEKAGRELRVDSGQSVGVEGVRI